MKYNWEAHTLIKSSTKTIIMALTWGHGWWRGSSSRGQNGRGFHHEACPLAVEHLVKLCDIFLLGGALIWELCCESGFGVNTVITMQQRWIPLYGVSVFVFQKSISEFFSYRLCTVSEIIQIGKYFLQKSRAVNICSKARWMHAYL